MKDVTLSFWTAELRFHSRLLLRLLYFFSFCFMMDGIKPWGSGICFVAIFHGYPNGGNLQTKLKVPRLEMSPEYLIE